MLRLIPLLSLFTLTAFGAVIIPFERDAPRVERYTYIGSHNQDSSAYITRYGADDNDQKYWTGFSMINVGPNEIVVSEPRDMDFANREYQFVSDDRSRRETFLWLTDYVGSGRTADYFETLMVFLPRENQMHVEEVGENLIVTLTTGEEVVFSSKTKTIQRGVLTEKALDMNPNRSQRKHAQVEYLGKGIVIRSDSRGSDPRLASHLQIIKKGLKPCRLASSIFWTQEGFPQFKFINDEDAYAIISEKCGAEYLP